VSPPRDRSSSASRPELAGLDLGKLRAKVLVFALTATKNETEAEDGTDHALMALFAPKHEPWDPKAKDLYLWLCDRVRDYLHNERKRRRRRQDAVLDEKVEDTSAAPSSRRTERLVEAKQEQEKCLAALREALAGDTEALGVLDQMARGVDEPADQARALGVPVERIYNANRRIDRAGLAVAKKFRR
jgi:DNA-directed RNA polymerase specialized sigma24 family protein